MQMVYERCAAVDVGKTYSLALGHISDPGTDTVTEIQVDWGDGVTDSFSSGGLRSTRLPARKRPVSIWVTFCLADS